jgi:hypothetical protein
MMLAGLRYIACMGQMRKAYKILATKSERHRAPGKHIHRRGESLIKIQGVNVKYLN